MSTASFNFLSDLEPKIEQELINPPSGIRLPYWDRFNALTGGLRMRELTLLTSGTGTGKTTFLANLATQTAVMGLGSYIASVEIGSVAFVLAMLSVVSKRDLNTGEKFDRETVEAVKKKWLPILRAGRLVFSKHDDRISPEVLTAEIIEAHEKHGVKFAILDNLQFFSQIVDARQERIEQDRVIRHFVRVVKQYDIHLFLIVHSRKPSNDDNQRIESLSDLKGSKTLSDEAWNIFALNKPKTALIEEGKAQMSDREILILKMRRLGKNVGRSIRFNFQDGRYTEEKGVGL